MIIAISSRVTEAPNYNEKRNSISFDFIAYLESLHIYPLIIPNNLINLDEYLSRFKISGVILTGGNNINPKKYNSKKKLTDVYLERDETENQLFNYALNNKMPILGICRGFQFINILLGGTLTHDVVGHVNVSHKLISENQYLSNKIVNSFHNQSIKLNQLSTKLTCLAKTSDNFVEAFENISMKVLAFQWHPERKINLFDSNLILKHFNHKSI